MIKFKLCPRCKGDLLLGEDLYGEYLTCIQCGYLMDLNLPELNITDDAEAEVKEKKNAA